MLVTGADASFCVYLSLSSNERLLFDIFRQSEFLLTAADT